MKVNDLLIDTILACEEAKWDGTVKKLEKIEQALEYLNGAKEMCEDIIELNKNRVV